MIHYHGTVKCVDGTATEIREKTREAAFAAAVVGHKQEDIDFLQILECHSPVCFPSDPFAGVEDLNEAIRIGRHLHTALIAARRQIENPHAYKDDYVLDAVVAALDDGLDVE